MSRSPRPPTDPPREKRRTIYSPREWARAIVEHGSPRDAELALCAVVPYKVRRDAKPLIETVRAEMATAEAKAKAREAAKERQRARAGHDIRNGMARRVAAGEVPPSAAVPPPPDLPAAPLRPMALTRDLTPDVQQRVVLAIQRGLYLTHAAALAGVPPAVLRDWLARGDAGEPAYEGFALAVVQAEASTVEALTSEIRNAKGKGDGPWASRAWLLERRWPSLYGRRTESAVTVSAGGKLQPLTRDVLELTSEQLRAIAYPPGTLDDSIDAAFETLTREGEPVNK